MHLYLVFYCIEGVIVIFFYHDKYKILKLYNGNDNKTDKYTITDIIDNSCKFAKSIS